MGRKPTAILSLISFLEIYVENKAEEYSSTGGQTPTLPITKDGRVNVTQVVEELREMPGADGVVKKSHYQYFFSDEGSKLTEILNSLAVVQGIEPIKNRTLINKDEEKIRVEIARQKKGMKTELEVYKAALAENSLLRRENEKLKAQLSFIQGQGIIFRQLS